MLRTRAPLSWEASSSIPSDLHVLGLPLAFILSQDQTLHCKMFCLTIWPYYHFNRIFNLYYISLYSILILITNSFSRVASFQLLLLTPSFQLPLVSEPATLHDFLFLKRTFIGLCRREPICFTVAGFKLSFLIIRNRFWLCFFNVLPRYRSGCKDANNLVYVSSVIFTFFNIFF